MDREKRYTTDVIADRVEFLGNNGQAPKQDAEEFFQGEDFFEVVDSDESIPF